MPQLNVVVSHQLTQDEALKRMKTFFDKLKTQFADNISDLREEWKGGTNTFSFSTLGFSVSGTLEVKSTEIELSGDLPLAVMFFRPQIESSIREQAESLLS